MSAHSPFGTRLLIKEETTYGTAVTPDVAWPVLSCDLQKLVLYQARQELSRESSRLPSSKVPTEYEVGGPVSMELGYEGFGYFWYMLLGAKASSGAGPYDHTYTMALDRPFMTGEQVNGTGIQGGTTQSRPFAGLQIARASIRIEAGGVMSAQYDLIGQDAGSPQTPTSVTLASVAPSNLIQAQHAGDLGWDGGTLDWRSIEISLDNGMVKRRVNNQLKVARPAPVNDTQLRVRVTRDMNDRTYETAHDGATESDLTLSITNGTHTIAHTWHNAFVDRRSTSRSRGDTILETLEFVPQADSTDGGWEVVVTNSQSSAVAG